jgi:hypothetical protein
MAISGCTASNLISGVLTLSSLTKEPRTDLVDEGGSWGQHDLSLTKGSENSFLTTIFLGDIVTAFMIASLNTPSSSSVGIKELAI